MPCFDEHMKTWQTTIGVHSKSDALKLFDSKSDACLKGWSKIWHVAKILLHNQTRRKIFISKFDNWKKFLFRNIVFLTKIFSFKMMLFRKNLDSKSCFLEKVLLFRIVFFKIARKTQNLGILCGKLNQNVIFLCNLFSKSSFLKKFCLQKSAF